MKKITNKLCFCYILCFTILSCSSDKNSNNTAKTNEQLLQEIAEVKAIGKVQPENTPATISTENQGRITKILIKEGDMVSKNQTLIELDPLNTSLDLQQNIAKLNTLRAQNKSIAEDITKAEIYAKELKDKYNTSSILVSKNAETKEKLNTDYSNWQQQEANLRNLKQQLKAQKLTESEQQIEINKAQNTITNFKITAPISGVITDLETSLGQSVSSAQELGKIMDITNPIIEAEVDELFANDIKSGQKVVVSPVGRNDTLAIGEIFYISPILSNKSILYETANEGDDRRVLKVKIKIKTTNKLTINTKVDCNIRIK